MSKTAYILGNRINRGGMAEIYLGKSIGENNFERICAIKRILPHYANDKEYIKMFDDEAKICMRLQHPNIVQVFDFAGVEDSWAIIMEYVDGVDLRSLLASCETLKIKIPVPMALHISANIARGLHYAHTKTDEKNGKSLDIIHRDISPQNILISYEGDVKVTDFGIARAQERESETKAGVVKGKYSYMSPEQVSGKKLDARSDVFSLAIVLWEALSMRRLFWGANEVETIHKVQKCQIPFKLNEINPDVDETLMGIVHKGLEPDINKRYKTAAAFENDLTKYLHKRYPDFSATELGDFIKQKLASRRMESSDFIKQTLALPTGVSKLGELSGEGKSRIQQSKISGQNKMEHTGIREGISERNGSKIFELSSISQHAEDIQMATNATKHKPLMQNINMSKLNTTPTSSFQPVTQRPHAVARFNNLKHFSSKRSNVKKYVTTFIQMTVAMALVVFGGTFYVKKIHVKQDKMLLELKATPNIVQLTLDGKPVKKGAYVKTPISLKVAPGPHALVIQRPGYYPYNYDFQGAAGDKLSLWQVFMKRKPSTLVMSVKIVAVGDPVRVSINNGYATGNTPMIADELLANEVHTITISRIGAPATEKPSHCQFRTPAEKISSKLLTVQVYHEHNAKLECVVTYQ